MAKKRQVEVQLDAVHPEELMKEPTPNDVWLRVDELSGGWPLVSILGEPKAVKDFLDEHWGLDTLPDWEELAKEKP